jgi:ribosomal 30S subunit maturation factor RimM
MNHLGKIKVVTSKWRLGRDAIWKVHLKMLYIILVPLYNHISFVESIQLQNKNIHLKKLLRQ